MFRVVLSMFYLRFPSETIATLEDMDFDKVDLDLVVKVITHISLNMEVRSPLKQSLSLGLETARLITSRACV